MLQSACVGGSVLEGQKSTMSELLREPREKVAAESAFRPVPETAGAQLPDTQANKDLCRASLLFSSQSPRHCAVIPSLTRTKLSREGCLVKRELRQPRTSAQMALFARRQANSPTECPQLRLRGGSTVRGSGRGAACQPKSCHPDSTWNLFAGER